MNKREFWHLTFPKGIFLSGHTRFWNLYMSLDEKQQNSLIEAIKLMPTVREPALY